MYLADCIPRICDWDVMTLTADFGRVLEMLHVLKRHPDIWREAFPRRTEGPEVWLAQLMSTYEKEAVEKWLLSV